MSAGPYVDALKGLGLRVLAEADLGYYQGDWVGIVRDDAGLVSREFGFISFGYGSCSACDEWQGAADATERAEILARVVGSAHWFEDFEDAQAYVRDAQANNVGYYVHEDGWPGFVEAAQAANEWGPQ